MKKLLYKLKKIFKLAVVSSILTFFGSVLITILAIFIRRKHEDKKVSKKSR